FSFFFFLFFISLFLYFLRYSSPFHLFGLWEAINTPLSMVVVNENSGYKVVSNNSQALLWKREF
ncbi:hypothetical protein AB7341_19565, partial [Providencia huaxiensis]|uniref:hypothetical protein n=1 Tax=Providencia huaxiensis TaxID=2027290 RepID=UPI0034E3B2C5